MREEALALPEFLQPIRRAPANLLGDPGIGRWHPGCKCCGAGEGADGEGDAFAPVGVWAMAGRAGAAPG